MYSINEIIFYISGIVTLLSLLLGSAVISGAEVALFSLSSKQISHCDDSKDPEYKKIVKLLENGESLLATILIFNNLLNITFFIFSSYLLWQFFGKENITKIVTIIHTTLSTIFIVLFGEFLPKMFANQHNLYISKKLSSFVSTLVLIFKPISIPLIKLGGIFGKEFSREKYILSSDQLNMALELTNLGDNSEEEEILKSIVTFGTLSAKQVMKTRIDVTAIDFESNFHELMNLINKSGYSRLPVYKDTIDNIQGTIFSKDILPHIDKSEKFKWQSLLKESFFIPETKKLDSLLLDFKEKRIHMAIVVDEYGGTSGLITMEDVIERIIGNVGDEFEQNESITHKKIDKSNYIFEGKSYLNDFCKTVGIDVSIFDDIKGESESIAGLLLEINGELPKVGDKIKYKHFTFTIIAVDMRRIKKVKVNIFKNSSNN